ncbi:MAG TPA: hypothetical protein VGD87_06795, partial [Archangium sp.]
MDAGLAEDAGVTDAGIPDAGLTDLDLDGLDDTFEAQLAAASLPVIGVHPSDACARGGLLYRARK